MKLDLLLSAILVGLLSSCAASPGPAPPDMGPIGDGLAVIGFSLIAVAVVITLGRLLK